MSKEAILKQEMRGMWISDPLSLTEQAQLKQTIFKAMDIYAKEQVDERCKMLVEALEKAQNLISGEPSEENVSEAYGIISEALTAHNNTKQ